MDQLRHTATTHTVLHKHELGRQPQSLDSYYVHKVENFCLHDAAASRDLTSWGRLFVLVGCLFVFTQSELFPGFDLFATRCFYSQLIVETDIFSPIKCDTQQQSYLHTGAFIHPRKKALLHMRLGPAGVQLCSH